MPDDCFCFGGREEGEDVRMGAGRRGRKMRMRSSGVYFVVCFA